MESFKGRLLLLIGIVGLAALVIYELSGGDLGNILSGANDQVVSLLAQAIAGAEGFGVAGAIPTRANNPGDITDTGYPGDTGQTIGQGIRVFATADDGWNALKAKLSKWLSGQSSTYPLGLSIAEVGQKYSGGDPNWAVNVANSLGVDPSVTLGELTGAQS